MQEIVGQIVSVILFISIGYFGRNKANWFKWELSAVILPYMLWGICFAIPIDKDPNFAPIEPWIITLGIIVWAIIRIIFGRRSHILLSPKSLLFYLCILSIIVYFWIPIFH